MSAATASASTKPPRRWSQQLSLLAMSLSMVLGVALGMALHHQYGHPYQPELPLEDFADLQRVIAEISASYVDQLETRELLENAIRGVLDGLDAHSDYLDAHAWQSLNEQTQGHFGGIGIEKGLVDAIPTVIAPIDDTPAQRAGIRAGDQVLSIDQVPTSSLSLDEIVTSLRGAPGSSVKLGVGRNNGQERLEVELVRDMIRINSVRTSLLDGDIAYVRIAQFQTHSAQDLEQGLLQLAEQPLAGLILDLRDNPGGLLQSSVRVSDLFLAKGLIVATQGRQRADELRFNATRKNLLAHLPMVVLINRGSASAAEIVAGALQDHGRALVVGEPSFGKGSVQSLLPLTQQRAIKLTTARYFTPNGRLIDTQGIAPDVLVDAPGWQRSVSMADTEALADPYISTALGELRAGLAHWQAQRRS